MSHPRVEEVDESDSDYAGDPDEMDITAFDFANPQRGTLGGGAGDSSSSNINDTLLSAETMQAIPNLSNLERTPASAPPPEDAHTYQVLYPLYFDASRTRAQGRRVKRSDAVASPLARGLVDALRHVGTALHVGLRVVFEPHKTHPKDWANPGRVRVCVKRDGRPVCKEIENKHHLYRLVAAYLKQHPTTMESPLQLKLHGMPPLKDNKVPAPAIPRGFRISPILPLHSPALSGGGVSDNFLKDMMAEMGGQVPEGLQGMMGGAGAGGGGGGQPKKVKDKKKK